MTEHQQWAEQPRAEYGGQGQEQYAYRGADVQQMMVPSEPAYYYPQPPMDQMGNGMMLGAHPHPHAMHMNMCADSMQPRAHYVLGPAAPPVPYGPHAHMPPAGVPMGAMPAAVPHLWVVRMRGLPFDATEDEIADFFYPLDLAPGGIALRYQAGAHGARPSGEAFVAFRSAEVRVMALERNKQNLRSRYIELFEASESDFFAHASPPRAAAGLLPGRGRGARGGARGGMDGRGGARGGGMPQPMPPAYYAPSPAAMAPQMMPPSAYMPAQPQPMHHPAAMGAHMHMQPHGAPPPYGYAPYAYAPQPPHAAMAPMGGQQPAPGGAGSRTVRMRGLPFTATDGNVAAFFAPLQPTSIALGRNANGGLTGEAHVSFASEHDARAAMARNRQMMGARYIELFPVDRGPRPAPGMAGPQPPPGAYDASGAAPAAPQGSTLKLRGMPYSATAEDVLNFFSGYGAVRESVSLGPLPGQAIVRFASPAEAARALHERNHAHMGARYIELFQVAS